ncbi:hypothetical protein ES703_65920 [subsurface metagenome]
MEFGYIRLTHNESVVFQFSGKDDAVKGSWQDGPFHPQDLGGVLNRLQEVSLVHLDQGGQEEIAEGVPAQFPSALQPVAEELGDEVLLVGESG